MTRKLPQNVHPETELRDSRNKAVSRREARVEWGGTPKPASPEAKSALLDRYVESLRDGRGVYLDGERVRRRHDAPGVLQLGCSIARLTTHCTIALVPVASAFSQW